MAYGSPVQSVLPGGLVLRPATPADVASAARLLVNRGDPADAVDLELVIRTEGHDGVAVVVDGDRVVSTLTLLDEVVHIDGVSVPAGQVELVATESGYEGRGLVRALMAWGHERSRARGHLLQVMIGIPYFYRQFGYSYAMPMAPWRPLKTVPPAAPDLDIRRARDADIPAMQALQERAQSEVDVRMGHTPACWRWLVARGGSEQWVAERRGTIVGTCRTVLPHEGAAVAELAVATDDVATALLAHVAARATADVAVQQRAGVASATQRFLGPAIAKNDWYYARVARLAPLLEHLESTLLRRLDGAGLADRTHDVLLSSWRSHVRFSIGPDGFRLLADGGPEQAPISKGGSGVPPDAIPPLLLGPYGAAGLEERLPDCYLGRQRDVMSALFPPQSSDLLTFYLAT